MVVPSVAPAVDSTTTIPSSQADITHLFAESTAIPRDVVQPFGQLATTECAMTSMATTAEAACVYARRPATSIASDSGPLPTLMVVACIGAVDAVVPTVKTSICPMLGSVTQTSLVGAT